MTMTPNNDDSFSVLHGEEMLPELNGGGGGHVVEETMGLKKGPWTAAEDQILVEYVRTHGEGNWNSVRKNSGLNRCGKSCRLRWANHLRPNLKKVAFSREEERLILELHAKYGNKWARMASQLHGRTDNEIKNYWNTRVKKRQRQGLPLYPTDNSQFHSQAHFQSNSHPLSHSTTLTIPTGLTPPTSTSRNPLQPTTNGTTPAFCFQIQSPTQSHNYPKLSTPPSLSPLSSPHHSNPTILNSLPVFNSIDINTTNTSSFSSSTPSFTFQRPTPIIGASLGYKRYRDSEGFSPPISPNPKRNKSMLRTSSMPDITSFQLTGTNSMPDIASFQLTGTNSMHDIASFEFQRTFSFPQFPRSQFNYSDGLVPPTSSVYSVKSELPSNQAPQTLQPDITFDAKVSSDAVATLAVPEETHSSCALLEHLLQEADQALACGGGNNSTGSFEEKHALDGYGQWLQSTSSMENSLSGEVSIHAKARPAQDDHLSFMPEDLSDLLSFNASTKPVSEWYSDGGVLSNGHSSTESVSDASLSFDMQHMDSLFPMAATADHGTSWKGATFFPHGQDRQGLSDRYS